MTVSRIVLIAPLICLMMDNSMLSVWLATGLYVVIAITDYLDGFVARRFNQMSEFGRFLDPIADKILIAAMFVALCANDVLTGWWIGLPIIILTREFLISGLREFMGPKGVTVHVSPLAKWKTTTQLLALGFLIPAEVYSNAALCGNLMLLLATFLTVVTGFDYMRSAREHFR